MKEIILTLLPTNIARLLTFCSGCREPADVAFALDSSGSVGPEKFQKEVDFLTSVIMGLNVNESMFLVASEQFADNSETKFLLNEYFTTEAMLNGFSFFYKAGSTNTGEAIEMMRGDLFGGSSDARPDVDNVGVVITDGRSNNPMETWQQAIQNREAGIHMIAMGIGTNLRQYELQSIASSPVDTNVINVDDFDSFDGARQILIDAICNSEYIRTLSDNLSQAR